MITQKERTLVQLMINCIIVSTNGPDQTGYDDNWNKWSSYGHIVRLGKLFRLFLVLSCNK